MDFAWTVMDQLKTRMAMDPLGGCSVPREAIVLYIHFISNEQSPGLSDSSVGEAFVNGIGDI